MCVFTCVCVCVCVYKIKPGRLVAQYVLSYKDTGKKIKIQHTIENWWSQAIVKIWELILLIMEFWNQISKNKHGWIK